MRKLFVLLLVLAGAFAAPYALAQGQGLNPQPAWYFASDFGQWNIVSTSPGTYTWSSTSTCQIPKVGGGSFFAFTTGTPVFIRDALNPTHNEVVTVTAPVNTSSACGFAASLSFTHTSFSVLSATGGAQEALNVLVGSTQPSPTPIILNRNWYALVSALPSYTSATPGTVIAALTGGTSAYLVDVTSVPWTYYYWTGTQYTSRGGTNPPTVVLGTGAGTTPTGLTVAGSGGDFVVTFKSGSTPTASANIFVATYPAVAAGGFNHAPTCTYTSVGATAYTTATNTASAGPPATSTLTASGTALTAATTYSFRGTCQ